MCYCYVSTVWVVAPSTVAKKEEKTCQGYFQVHSFETEKLLIAL